MSGPDIETVAASTERLLTTVESLDAAAMQRPSLLPRWTIAHVLAHVARNADGNRRMLEGAAQGATLEQYPGRAEQRAADIETTARRPRDAIVDDLRTSAAKLADAMSAMPSAAWSHPVRAFVGEYPASETVRRRRREVEVHHADLGAGYRPMDWPADMVLTELAAAAGGLGPRLPLGTAVRVVANDLAQAWEIGSGPASVAVSGPSAWVLAWLLGRAVPPGTLHAPAGLPPLRPWG